MDAALGMEGNGPTSPEVRDRLILADDKVVELDALIATMMGYDPGKLHFLQKVKKVSVGAYDLKVVENIGELKVPVFNLPPLSGAAILKNGNVQTFLKGRILLRPKSDPIPNRIQVVVLGLNSARRLASTMIKDLRT